MRCRVVCGLREVMLSFCPIRQFNRVDLPTLGCPTMASVPQRNSAVISRRRMLGAVLTGCMLGGMAAGTHAVRANIQLWNPALDLEYLLMRFAAGDLQNIIRHRHMPALQEFLQSSLWILAGLAWIEVGQSRL